MTREEAIFELRYIAGEMPSMECANWIKAISMAVKALERKPCDDAIRRQDLREPRFIIAENDYQKGWNDALESVYENAPSIQPQPKMGHWSHDGSHLENRFICSNCGYKQTNYCPNCGLKMQEVEE